MKLHVRDSKSTKDCPSLCQRSNTGFWAKDDRSVFSAKTQTRTANIIQQYSFNLSLATWVVGNSSDLACRQTDEIVVWGQWWCRKKAWDMVHAYETGYNQNSHNSPTSSCTKKEFARMVRATLNSIADVLANAWYAYPGRDCKNRYGYVKRGGHDCSKDELLRDGSSCATFNGKYVLRP